MDQSFSIAVLPFLKTSGPVRLGGLQFRSTEDLTGLSSEQASAVREVTRMLFLQDDLRIKAATYAIVPYVDVDRAPYAMDQLENIQSVVAYLYASPHYIFGNPFLHSEHASVVLLSPARVYSSLIRSLYNVVPEGSTEREDDNRHVDGFAGLYNFRHHFWVASGSKIYGPIPHPVLNISQDLKKDLERLSDRAEYRPLLDLIRKPESAASARYLTALRWYASAHRESTDDLAAIVHLSIAFEALLGLPQGEKADRLVDAISLLLGRIPRLDGWARQFYDARSRIVHEGRADGLRFVASDEGRREGQLYQPLFSYGAQIFRLCLGTLLVGLDLANQAGLERRFITNQERYTRLCQVLDDENIAHSDRLAIADDLVSAIDEMQFVGETGLRLETMIGAVRRAAQLVLDGETVVDSGLDEKISRVAECERTDDKFMELGAILALDDILPNVSQHDEGLELLRRLVKSISGATFMHYYWLKKVREGPEAEN